MTTDRPIILSFGGGVQSHALLALLGQGRYPGRAPSELWFCDPRNERPQTYEFMERVTKPYCVRIGIPLVTLERAQGKVRGPDLAASYRKRGEFPLRRNRECTVDWKIEVMRKESTRRGHNTCVHGIVPGSRGKMGAEHVGCTPVGVETHVGISLDELHRARTGLEKEWEVKRYPLIEARFFRDDCVRLCQEEFGEVPIKSGCWFCFAGETQVVTPDGARQIEELAVRGRATVLVPRPRSGYADWREVEVCSFGPQPLMRLTLRRGRSVKVIYATAEHRWVTKGADDCWRPFQPTRALVPGDVIPSARATPITASRHPVRPSPFGVAHGFVYGDGHLEASGKLAAVMLHGDKNLALLPYVSMCAPRPVTLPGGKTAMSVDGLPRRWKSRPPLDECRGYLLGWLAGYVAADGSVSGRGQAALYSAVEDNLAVARDVCDLLGVRTSPISAIHRHVGRISGHAVNGGDTLYRLNLFTRGLPVTFWVQDKHRERILNRHEAGERQQDWVVESVEATDRVEEVYCAIVPGREMFVLADNVVTGNCKYQRPVQWREVWEDRADGRWALAVEWEQEVMAKNIKAQPFIDTTVRRTLPEWARMWALGEQLPFVLDQSLEQSACDGGYCMV